MSYSTLLVWSEEKRASFHPLLLLWNGSIQFHQKQVVLLDICFLDVICLRIHQANSSSNTRSRKQEDLDPDLKWIVPCLLLEAVLPLTKWKCKLENKVIYKQQCFKVVLAVVAYVHYSMIRELFKDRRNISETRLLMWDHFFPLPTSALTIL